MNTDYLESFLLVCAADLSRWQHIIHVLQEGLVFYFVVSKDEADAFSMLASCSVQTLQVIHQVGCIVWAGKEKHKINMHTLSSLITNFTASKTHPYVVKCNQKVQQQKTRSHKNFNSSIYVPICMKFLMRLKLKLHLLVRAVKKKSVGAPVWGLDDESEAHLRLKVHLL